MSLAARQAIIALDNTKVFFQNPDTQKADLLNPDMTDSNLIALIQFLIDRGHILEFTAIRSDHHVDGYNGHNPGGKAFDCWPLGSAIAGTYLDASALKPFLADVAAFSGLYQLGLAGTAYTADNVAATGLIENFAANPCVFHDEGADHIHCGVHRA